MSKYIDAEALVAVLRDVRKNLPLDSKDFHTRDEMLLNLQQYIGLLPAADVVALPFKSDGIAMIYAGAFKVTNVEDMGDEPLKAVVFRVTQEESDRYDAEAARIINERL